MDQQTFNVIFGVFSCLLSIIGIGAMWWVNNMWDMLKSQQSQLSDLHINLAANYAPRAELRTVLDKINDKLDDIQKRVHQGV